MIAPNCREAADEAYRQGVEDLADKIFGLIYASDGEISAEEIAEFVNNERMADLPSEETADV
jgi:DNA-binding transcriptional regulator GbsR (MarR family)